MTLNLRFILLLGFLLALFLGGIALLNSTQRAETARAVEAAQKEQSRLLDEIVALVGYPVEQFSRDYSLWDEMVTFVEKPTDEWARINIQASIDTFRLRAVWVLRADGTLVHTATPASVPPSPAIPIATADLGRLARTAPFSRFFARIGDDLCEIRACPIQPSDDLPRTTPPKGWLLAAWRWSDDHLATLGKLTGATATIASPQTTLSTGLDGGGFELARDLPALDGSPLALLKLTYRPPSLESAEEFNREELLLFVLQGVLLIAITTICIQRWVLSPVHKIIASLRASDRTLIAPLAKRNDETGLIARLVQSHFADQETLSRNERALAHTLAERVRLGRDLHDNVIQSLFATGMGLAATRSFVRSSPAQVEEGLDQVRACLNEVIRDVRTFIVGLEPDSLDGKTFPQAVAGLAEALRSLCSVDIEIDIDEAAALSLPSRLQQHALQLLREALLNSIRHSNASRIQISLHHSSEHVTISLVDDGPHVSPSDKGPAGQGLASLAERAALVGATCEIAPHPKRGTRIRIAYPVTGASLA